MKRIKHPRTPHARPFRIGVRLAATCLFGMAACVSDGATDELGTVKYTPGQPITAEPTLPDPAGPTLRADGSSRTSTRARSTRAARMAWRTSP